MVLSMIRNVDRQNAGATGICVVASTCVSFGWRLPSHKEPEVSLGIEVVVGIDQGLLEDMKREVTIEIEREL